MSSNRDSSFYSVFDNEEMDFNFDINWNDKDEEPFTSSKLIEMLTGSNLVEISDEIKKSWKDVKEQTGINQITKLSDKRKRFVKTQIEFLKKSLRTQEGKRIQDKLTFVGGVTYIWLTCLIMIQFPDAFPIFYLVTVVPMIAIRYITYKNIQYQFFLADLCYFVNALLICALFFYPSPSLFTAIFFLTNGPVAWAIFALRNALVFHSLDKLTSVAIHYFPPLVLYSIRWLSPKTATFSFLPLYPQLSKNPDPELDSSIQISVPNAFFLASVVYMIWQALYCYFILLLNAEKVFDKSHATTYTWIVADYMKKRKGSFMTKLFMKCPQHLHLPLYIISQYCYALLTMLPVIFYYQSFWAHTIFILFLNFTSCYNGANYYIEVFSSRYKLELERLEKHASILSPIQSPSESEEYRAKRQILNVDHHKDIETVEDLITTAAKLFRQSNNEQIPIPIEIARTWENASRTFALTKNIKKSFQAEEITSEDERIVKLANGKEETLYKNNQDNIRKFE